MASITPPLTSTHLPHLPWHPIYRAACDVVEGVHKGYATGAYAKTKDDRAVESAQEDERNAAQQFYHHLFLPIH